jgi:hypothetical protein
MIRHLYAIFVGLFFVLFVGTGVAVFYIQPKEPAAPAWIINGKVNPAGNDLKQQVTYNIQRKEFSHDMQVYNRNVSIIVLGCAIAGLVISIALAARLGPIADGLLVGGVFTLLYGMGRGIASDSNQYRFAAAGVGLAAAIALGYATFSRSQQPVSQKATTTRTKKKSTR